MTRTDYIKHINMMSSIVNDMLKLTTLISKAKGVMASTTSLEAERAKKTSKMMDDLVKRLYEDQAISERVLHEQEMCGEAEQAEMGAISDDLLGALLAFREDSCFKPSFLHSSMSELVDFDTWRMTRLGGVSTN